MFILKEMPWEILLLWRKVIQQILEIPQLMRISLIIVVLNKVL